MSTTHTARQALVCLGAALAIITAGCSSFGDPVPGNTTSTGSTTPMAMDTNGAAGGIDRTDPTAVAAAFATYFAAGDTPSACKLATPAGVKQINGNWGDGSHTCDARQTWATTASLVAQCVDVVDKSRRDYVFKSAAEFSSFSAFNLTLGQLDGTWSVLTVGKLDLAQPDQPCETS